MRTILRIRKSKVNPYTMINKRTLQDPALSLRAKGLLAYLLSLPDDWQVYITELPKHSTDGIKTIRSTMRELIANGYVRKELKRGIGGLFSGQDYWVYEEPL